MRKFLIIISLAFILFAVFYRLAKASDKDVICTNTGCSGFNGPLFFESNVVPGEEVVRSFEITNDSGENLDIILVTDKSDGDNALIEKVSAVIYKNTSEIIFSGQFAQLLGKDISLGKVMSNDSEYYEIVLGLPKSLGNSYQGSFSKFSLKLLISGEITGRDQVLGSADSSENSEEGKTSSPQGSTGTDSVIGQVLGLSDTSSGKFQLFLSAIGLSLILTGLLISRRSSETVLR